MVYIDDKLSAFPEEVDRFIEVYDLSPSQVDSAKRLSELRMKPSLTNAEQEEVLVLTSQLRDVMITSHTFNKFASALFSTQKFFRDNVQGFIEQKQKVWDGYIKSFKHDGKWSAGKSYKFQNMVSVENGDLYICLKDHSSTANNAPHLNPTLWRFINSKGDKGDPGLATIYKGDWTSVATYSLGDAVTYINTGTNGGLIYIAKRANTNKTPHNNPNDWTLYSQTYAGTSEPLGAAKGTHFIHVTEG